MTWRSVWVFGSKINLRLHGEAFAMLRSFRAFIVDHKISKDLLLISSSAIAITKIVVINIFYLFFQLSQADLIRFVLVIELMSLTYRAGGLAVGCLLSMGSHILCLRHVCSVPLQSFYLSRISVFSITDVICMKNKLCRYRRIYLYLQKESTQK